MKSSFGGGVGGVADKKFQVWLEENSRGITFVYDYGIPVTSATVGIAKLTNDFQIITTATHTSSIAVLNDNNTAWPGAQRKYQFIPPSTYDLVFQQSQGLLGIVILQIKP
ncbi:MAG: hypothetical protein IPN14_14365 [Bacteroidetes bacterium]|nr:hypothetical protein [Bacteroidota bacterium]